LMLMYPTGAADIFDQIFRARELAVYGVNPFQVPPDAAMFATDPLRPYVGGWAGTTSPYGPVWELLAILPARLAGDDLWTSILVFKGMVIIAYAIAAGLVYAILRRVRPAWAARGLLFFAWNPLLLWETAGNGHNDMIQVAYLLLSLYLLVYGGVARILAPAALALAVLCKFVPILLLPVLLATLWQLSRPARPLRSLDRAAWARALTPVVLGGVGFIVLVVALYLPFWYGPETVGALARRDLFTASIPNSLKDVLAGPLGFGEEPAKDVVRTFASAVTALAALGGAAWVLWHSQAGRSRAILRTAFRACYGVFFVYLLLAALWYQPWYQIWLIALTPLTMRLSHARRTLVMNAGGVANYFVWSFLLIWNGAFGPVGQWTSALMVNAPVLVYSAYEWLRPGRRRGPARAGAGGHAVRSVPPAREPQTIASASGSLAPPLHVPLEEVEQLRAHTP
ncbi:MAG TPA: hypothetical protein VM536_05225, partial [Chloroflexia bacterium]|nr:hypothetical protein [Chloroflexia bacterium]